MLIPAPAQPDLNRGGMAREKTNDKEAIKKETTRKVFLQNAGEMNAEQLRFNLQAQGITDEKTQNAILEHAKRVEEARKSVDEKAATLRANAKPNAAMADAQFNVLLNDYLASIEDYKIAREKSVRQLDEKIAYTKNPRLHATLLTMGLVGDAPAAGNSNFMGGGVTIFNHLMGEGQPPRHYEMERRSRWQWTIQFQF